MHSIPLQLSTNPQGNEIEEKLFQLTDPLTGVFKYLQPDICYRRYSSFQELLLHLASMDKGHGIPLELDQNINEFDEFLFMRIQDSPIRGNTKQFRKERYLIFKNAAEK